MRGEGWSRGSWLTHCRSGQGPVLGGGGRVRQATSPGNVLFRKALEG